MIDTSEIIKNTLLQIEFSDLLNMWPFWLGAIFLVAFKIILDLIDSEFKQWSLKRRSKNFKSRKK